MRAGFIVVLRSVVAVVLVSLAACHLEQLPKEQQTLQFTESDYGVRE